MTTTTSNPDPHRSLPEVHGSIPLATHKTWWRRFLAFAGPGYLVSVGYMDPGNWATDLAGGAAESLSRLPPEKMQALAAAVANDLAPHASKDGYVLSSTVLVASAGPV